MCRILSPILVHCRFPVSITKMYAGSMLPINGVSICFLALSGVTLSPIMKFNAKPTNHCSQTLSRHLSLFEHISCMDDNTSARHLLWTERDCWGDHECPRWRHPQAVNGLKQSTWPRTDHTGGCNGLKQLTWPRTDHSGGCWRLVALNTFSGASRGRQWWMQQLMCKFDYNLFHMPHSKFHWLDISQRVQYQLRVIVSCSTVPAGVCSQYLMDYRAWVCASDISSHQCLQSAGHTMTSSQLAWSSSVLCCGSNDLQLTTRFSFGPNQCGVSTLDSFRSALKTCFLQCNRTQSLQALHSVI